MSNIFYKFLSERIISYFKLNEPAAGDKYQILLENEEQVKYLYNELKENKGSFEFYYRDDERGVVYPTYALGFGSVELIVAAAMERGPQPVHPDFLAMLRNKVGMDAGYENKAILFIHCSSKDSILGGAGSLGKEGMPLNIEEIEKDIDRKIDETDYSELDKTILKLYMTNKKKELAGTMASIFEYEDILECLMDSQISADKYRKFELFPDERLSGLNGKKLKDSLEDNHQNYIKVSEIHSYGDETSKLENLYGEEGAKVLSKENWEEVSFSEIEKFIKNRKNKSTIEYRPILNDPEVWDKEEGRTKAKNRVRNILVFLSDDKEKAELTFAFSEYTRQAGIDIGKEFKEILKVSTSGKSLKATVENIDDQAVFCRFKYNVEGKKFDFKIAVLRCSPKVFESIKTQYSVEITTKKSIQNAVRIKTDEDSIILNPEGTEQKNVVLNKDNQNISVEKNQCVTLNISEDYPYSEENDDIHFSVKNNNFIIPVIKTFETDEKTNIEGLKLWYLKHIKQCDFEMRGDNYLILGTKPYCTRGEFRSSLELEKKYIELGSPFAVERSEEDPALEKVDICLPDEVREAFDEIISYFKQNHKIPTLVYMNEELKTLYQKYLEAVKVAVENIKEGSYLEEKDRGLFCLGMVKRLYGDCEILLSPLHPVNIAYQLFVETLDIDGIDEEHYALLRKFQETSLMPYINFDPCTKETRIYTPAEQLDSPEWKIYVEESLPRYKGSKDFVSKLVAEKIKEFTTHFDYLFSPETEAPVKINLVNTGDCRESVQGILKYYAHELKDTNSRKVIPVQVTVYARYKMDTAFETISKIEDLDDLKDMLNFKENLGSVEFKDVVDVYRNNVRFYSRTANDKFGYAHITFLEMDDEHQAINTMMADIPSGVVMNGITSGVPSERLGNSYRTGFGTKYANTESDLMNIAMKYNSLNAAMNGDTYRKGSCYALKTGFGKEQTLEKIYDASNWVTFINPRVDLSYFKTDPGAKDLLIIHYSDQYNMTSSGYDAITVTRKSKQYEEAISRYLTANGVDKVQEHARKIINIFNALNGDWLLRMLSYKSHFSVEKISILAAMKLAVKRYSTRGLIWIPISLEEIFRVSGTVGLPQSESDFSQKNLGFEGHTSDDLLLIGIQNGEKVKVTFYPIEVKTGKVDSNYLEKGIRQVLNTRDIFDQILGKGECLDKDIKTRLYRNFFMQQAVVSAEKMIMYEVGISDFNWKDVTESDLRRKLLNEEYEIVDFLIPEMGKAGLISFKEECFQEKEFRNQEVLVLEKTKEQGVEFLINGFDIIPEVQWQSVENFSDEEVIDLQSRTAETASEETEETLINSVEEEGSAESESVDTTDAEGDPQNVQNIPRDAKTENTASDQEVRVFIGEDQYDNKVYWEFGNKALANRHLLITGISGQGKTYCIQTMLYELSKWNISAVIFDYTGGFKPDQLEGYFQRNMGDKLEQKKIYQEGVPINPFKRHQLEAGDPALEKTADVAARLADIFAHVYNFGDQQYSAVFESVYNGIEKYGKQMSMKLFGEELNLTEDKNKTAKSVTSKMLPFFRTVEFSENQDFDWGKILYADEAKVNIIQLDNFTDEMKVCITEMMLWDMWYYTKKAGTKDRPFVVVLDEAQNLSHSAKSPTKAILTEGRKFGWSGWFATQSLGVLKNEEVLRLQQAAFKLHFKPTDNEMVKLAKQLDITGEKDWLKEVQNLKKGQCIAVGDRMRRNGSVGPAVPVVTSVASFEKRTGEL